MVGWLWNVVEWFFPPRCVGCGSYHAWWCDDCDDAVVLVRTPVCPRCRAITSRGEYCSRCRRHVSLTGILAGAHWRAPLSPAVKALKYRHATIIAPRLARFAILALGHLDRRAVIVPVPLHPSRLRQRGHNQAALLAEIIARVSGLPIHYGLRRVRRTASQTGLSRQARHDNVRGAFVWHGTAPATVLLVDDVATTGATLNAAAIACRAAGARVVWGLVVAQR